MKKIITGAIYAALALTLAGCASDVEAVPTDMEQMDENHISDIQAETYEGYPYIGDWKATSIIDVNGEASAPSNAAGDYTIRLMQDGTSHTMLGAKGYDGTWIPITNEDLGIDGDLPEGQEAGINIVFPGLELTDEDGTVAFAYTEEPEALTLYDPNLGSTVVFTRYRA